MVAISSVRVRVRHPQGQHNHLRPERVGRLVLGWLQASDTRLGRLESHLHARVQSATSRVDGERRQIGPRQDLVALARAHTIRTRRGRHPERHIRETVPETIRLNVLLF